MGSIPQHTIEQVAAANDIVEVIGTYFPLKRAGTNFRALCPFHQEKTPSFHVSPTRQSFHWPREILHSMTRRAQHVTANLTP